MKSTRFQTDIYRLKCWELAEAFTEVLHSEPWGRTGVGGDGSRLDKTHGDVKFLKLA